MKSCLTRSEINKLILIFPLLYELNSQVEDVIQMKEKSLFILISRMWWKVISLTVKVLEELKLIKRSFCVLREIFQPLISLFLRLKGDEIFVSERYSFVWTVKIVIVHLTKLNELIVWILWDDVLLIILLIEWWAVENLSLEHLLVFNSLSVSLRQHLLLLVSDMTYVLDYLEDMSFILFNVS